MSVNFNDEPGDYDLDLDTRPLARAILNHNEKMIKILLQEGAAMDKDFTEDLINHPEELNVLNRVLKDMGPKSLIDLSELKSSDRNEIVDAREIETLIDADNTQEEYLRELLLLRDTDIDNPEKITKFIEKVGIKFRKNTQELENLKKSLEEGQLNEVIKKEILYTDPNYRYDEGKTALMIAIETKKYNLVPQLLLREAYPNLYNSNGKTALILAVEAGDLKALTTLLAESRDIDINAYDLEGKTALMTAVERGYNEITDLLVQNGADLTIIDENNKTALDYAKGNKELEDILQQKLIIAYNTQEEYLRELLLLSDTDIDNPEKITKFIEKVGIQFRKNKQELKNLKKSLEKGKLNEVIKKEILHTDPNYLYEEGKTALMIAIETKKYDLVPQLLQRGAYPNLHNSNGKTALILAVEAGDLKAVTTLLAESIDIDINTCDLEGKRDIDIRDIDINAYDLEGKTALMTAVERGYNEITDLLVQNGADLTIIDENNKTALDYAKGNKELEDILQQPLIQYPKLNAANLQKFEEFFPKDPEYSLKRERGKDFEKEKYQRMLTKTSDSSIKSFKTSTINSKKGRSY